MTIAVIVIGLILLTVVGLTVLMWNSEADQVKETESFQAKGGLVLDESAAIDTRWIGSAFGWVLLVIGALASIVSFFLPTSVETYGAGDVHNVGMMQIQLMVMLCGIGASLGGLMLICAGAIIQRLP